MFDPGYAPKGDPTETRPNKARNKTTLTVCSFNVRGVMPAAPLLHELLNDYQIDIMAVCEHWLFNDSLMFLNSIHKDYRSHAVADISLNPYHVPCRGKGGVALLYRKELLERKVLIPLSVQDDRIIGVKLCTHTNLELYIFCVYMPCSKESIDVYNAYVDKLSDITNQYKHQGEVIFLGDLNAELKGDKCPQPKSCRSPMLQRFVTNNQLMSLSVEAKCVGPNYTYDPYDTGTNRSLIDHILINKVHLDLVKNSSIVGKDASHSYNSSDHLPVIATLSMMPLISEANIEKVTRPKLNWNKRPECKLEYKSLLSRALINIKKPNIEKCDVKSMTHLFENINDCITTCANKCVPQSKFNKFLKPQWTSQLKPLHMDMLIKRRMWIAAGRITGSETHCIYRQSHNIFRKKFQQVAADEDRKLFEDIDESAEIDSRHFWHFVNRRRKKNIKTIEIQFGDKILRNPKDICEAYADQYEDVYTPQSNPTFDEKHKEAVLIKFQKYLIESKDYFCEIMDGLVTEEELTGAIKELKMGKAAGPDLATNEHIIYGGPLLVAYILHLFRIMVEREALPASMKKGILISIPKDSSKNQTSQNQRGITLLSVTYKLFERIILNRFTGWCDFKNLVFPDPLQSAYQSKLSSLHVSFNLQECINYNTERGAKVYCCFLDSAKAFDVVWHIGLFVKLYELGIKGKMWRVIIEAYTGMTSTVLHEGVLSRWFPVKQSVRQGGVLSPRLYLLQINDLLVELRNSGYGAYVGNIYCGSPTQADDIALISLTPVGLQAMMDISYQYGSRWRSTYNSTKSKVIVYGESKWKKQIQQKQRKWFLGHEIVHEYSSVKHVGILLNSTGSINERIDAACTKSRGAFMSLCGAGVRPKALNPLTGANLYKAIVLPRALYGCELWHDMSKDNIQKLEKSHRLNNKLTQGLATRVRSDMVTSLLGQLPLEFWVDRAKLLFLCGLCNMPGSYASKEIFQTKLHLYMINEQFVKKGFVNDIINRLKKSF